MLKLVLVWNLALVLSHSSLPCLWTILSSSGHLTSFSTSKCLRYVFLQCSLSVLSSAKAFCHTTLTFKSMQQSSFSSLLTESRRKKKNSTLSALRYPSWISIAYNFSCLNLKSCFQLWNSQSASEFQSHLTTTDILLRNINFWWYKHITILCMQILLCSESLNLLVINKFIVISQ